MIGGTCVAEDCHERVTWTLSGKCSFHEALSTARNLSPEAFDKLRDTLAITPPLTDEERRVRRVRSALSQVKWTAQSYQRAKVDARKAGATPGQIADAARLGKAGAK